MFQHTATRRWLPYLIGYFAHNKTVSTHSHPKVAALPQRENALRYKFQHTATRRWLLRAKVFARCKSGFNTQPPEGGCNTGHARKSPRSVSTHSHPKVAAKVKARIFLGDYSFNTQPPEGGCVISEILKMQGVVSTHSHPKVAACLVIE